MGRLHKEFQDSEVAFIMHYYIKPENHKQHFCLVDAGVLGISGLKFPL